MNKLRYLYNVFRLHLIAGRLCHSVKYAVESTPLCYIFLAADYGNLGDVAITYAQKQFLSEQFPQYKIVEVPVSDTLAAIPAIFKIIKPQDIVTIVGGGNMGDMYGDLELLRLLVVKTFKDNRIILFPQTIDYSRSTQARWLLNLSKKVYGNHKQLTMTAREIFSFVKMKEYYPHVDVRLTPDIVMLLDESNMGMTRRDIVTLCLRNDRERKANINYPEIKTLLKQQGLEVEVYDTHIGGQRYSENEKSLELHKIFAQFAGSRLVVTDRLHGMIFAYITGTPAIVLPNSNHKVVGCYKWIANAASNIMLVDSIDKLCAILENNNLPQISPLHNPLSHKFFTKIITQYD